MKGSCLCSEITYEVKAFHPSNTADVLLVARFIRRHLTLLQR